jgi:hypothetical protein
MRLLRFSGGQAYTAEPGLFRVIRMGDRARCTLGDAYRELGCTAEALFTFVSLLSLDVMPALRLTNRRLTDEWRSRSSVRSSPDHAEATFDDSLRATSSHCGAVSPRWDSQGSRPTTL